VRAFLLSPAYCGGERAKMLLRKEAQFELAVRLKKGAPIGEVFAFISGLYFRGKLAYAHAFEPMSSLVITPNRGLLPIATTVTRQDIERFAETDIAGDDPNFRQPLLRDAKKLSGEAVLLGSIATAKYVEPLLEVLGDRLLVPPDFAGRGDMSRGGLLLRHARAGKELRYEPVSSVARHGARPAKLKRHSRAEITALVTATCERIFESGGVHGVAYVDWKGNVLVCLGDPPIQKDTLYAPVGRNGTLVGRGPRLKKRLETEAALLNAVLEGVQ
jgi:hypothetical protein